MAEKSDIDLVNRLNKPQTENKLDNSIKVLIIRRIELNAFGVFLSIQVYDDVFILDLEFCSIVFASNIPSTQKEKANASKLNHFCFM